MAVDISVPEGIPHSGLLTSDQGIVKIGDFDLMKVSRATIRLMNNVAVYRETGKRTGTTYAGNQRVTGQITRAMLNMAEHRFALGVEAGQTIGGQTIFGQTIDAQDIFYGPGVLTPTQILAIISDKTNAYPVNPSVNSNFYPLRVDVELEINARQLAVTTTENQKTVADTEPGIQKIKCKNALITNMVIAYDSRGIITSGPLDFIGSAISWSGAK